MSNSMPTDLTKFEPFRVYRELEINEQLCIFGDPAEGRDFCAAVAISKKHADFPLVYNEKVESSQFGHELHKMAKFVKHRTGMWPTIGVERNTGQATIHVLLELNYPHLFRMRVFDHISQKETSKVGWTTTQASRIKMLEDFALAFRQGSLKIYDYETLSQMQSFVIKYKRSGLTRVEAEAGRKDDLCLAVAGAYQLYTLVPTFDAEEISDEEFAKEQAKWRFR